MGESEFHTAKAVPTSLILAARPQVMRVRAPALQDVALKIELAIDQEVGTLTDGELCLAALRRDVRRLLK